MPLLLVPKACVDRGWLGLAVGGVGKFLAIE